MDVNVRECMDCDDCHVNGSKEDTTNKNKS